MPGVLSGADRIWNKKYHIFKIINFDNENFENNTKKTENDLNHANILIHNLIQAYWFM